MPAPPKYSAFVARKLPILNVAGFTRARKRNCIGLYPQQLEIRRAATATLARLRNRADHNAHAATATTTAAAPSL